MPGGGTNGGSTIEPSQAWIRAFVGIMGSGAYLFGSSLEVLSGEAATTAGTAATLGVLGSAA